MRGAGRSSRNLPPAALYPLSMPTMAAFSCSISFIRAFTTSPIDNRPTILPFSMTGMWRNRRAVLDRLGHQLADRHGQATARLAGQRPDNVALAKDTSNVVAGHTDDEGTEALFSQDCGGGGYTRFGRDRLDRRRAFQLHFR